MARFAGRHAEDGRENAMRLLGGLLLMVAIVLGIAVVALSFVDLGRFAPQIEAAAQRATGRELKIAGPLHIGISLSPELVAENVTFANASWGTRPEMVKAKRLEARLAVLPLLSGRVALKSVELEGADIYVETDSAGKGNWEFGTAAPAANAPAQKGGGPSLAGAPDVKITDFKLTYRDGKSRSVIKADFSKVTIKPSSGGAHVTIVGDVNGTDIAFDADVAQAGSDIALRNAALTVGATSVKGDLAVALGGARPNITGTLTSDKLDLTPLAGGGKKVKGGPLFSHDPLPLDQLGAVNADMTVRVGALTYGKVQLADLKLPIKLQNSVLSVPLSVSYRGTPINLAVTANGGTHSVGLDMRTSGVDFGKLLEDLDVTNMLAAKADIAAKLSGSGRSMHDIAASANGLTNFALGEGTINSRMFALVSNDLAKAVIPNGSSSNTARLTCALSAFSFQRGVGTSKALAIETDSLITTGSGTVNLGTEQLDLLLKPKPKQASFASLAFPIRVSGPLNAPSAGIDREGAVVGIATAVGGVALTGGVGALLPLMSTGNSASGTGGCAKLAATASQDSGIVGGVTGAAKGIGAGVGGAADSIGKGIGDLFK